MHLDFPPHDSSTNWLSRIPVQSSVPDKARSLRAADSNLRPHQMKTSCADIDDATKTSKRKAPFQSPARIARKWQTIHDDYLLLYLRIHQHRWSMLRCQNQNISYPTMSIFVLATADHLDKGKQLKFSQANMWFFQQKMVHDMYSNHLKSSENRDGAKKL
ncbi:hypothetical protein MRB53_015296 [Persea americana]|uniref:Uncharacterized protein n=1 Tax=Persea americana TaxID=3435 RepID=A0ACC2KD84_PERAE|nr:hypothetical protein MRB53_015296 [Persea americana]